MKKFTPKLVRLSDEALAKIPDALAAVLPAGRLAYAIKPEDNGSIFISDAPDATGRICTFVNADQVEFLPKTTAKSPKVSIEVTITPDQQGCCGTQILTVPVPENVTDEELLAIVRSAAENLTSYSPDAENPELEPGMTPSAHTMLAMYLSEYGTGETTVLRPDLAISVQV